MQKIFQQGITGTSFLRWHQRRLNISQRHILYNLLRRRCPRLPNIFPEGTPDRQWHYQQNTYRMGTGRKQTLLQCHRTCQPCILYMSAPTSDLAVLNRFLPCTDCSLSPHRFLLMPGTCQHHTKHRNSFHSKARTCPNDTAHSLLRLRCPQ